MKHTPFRILRHAAMMVGRTLRSYALLSVTIVLSFSLLLGYLVWTDSTLYNTYKQAFSRDRNVVAVQNTMLKNPALAEALTGQAAQYGETDYLRFETAGFDIEIRNRTITLEDGRKVLPPDVTAISVPRHAWSVYVNPQRTLEVVWLDGKEHHDYHLNGGEILLDERLYTLYGLAEKDNRFDLVMSKWMYEEYGFRGFSGIFEVVGLIRSDEPLAFDKLEEDTSDSVSLNTGGDSLKICFSAEDFNSADYPKFDWSNPIFVFYSKTPENIDALIRSMGIMSSEAVYRTQNGALEKIRTEVSVKAIITAALLLILGINLYSSFSNALNDRRFEIGVKRAVGASKWSIIRQFLYESLIVMISNILLSVWLVTTAGLAYKVISEHIPDVIDKYRDTFTLTISPYSVGMFAACSLTLTVVFSLVFAYRATQVQIVDYLKAE